MLNLVVAFVIGYYCDRLFGVSLFGWPQRWLFRGSSGPFVLAVFFGFVAVGLLALTFPPDLAASHKLPAFWGKLSESRLLLSLSGFFIGSFVSAWLSETDPSQDSKRSDLFYTQRSLVVVGLGIAGLILALDHDYGIMSRVAKVQTTAFTLELAQPQRGGEASIASSDQSKAPVSSDPTSNAFLIAADLAGQMERDERLFEAVFDRPLSDKRSPEHDFIRTVIDPTVSRLRIMHDRWQNRSLEFILDPRSVHAIRVAMSNADGKVDDAVEHLNVVFTSVVDRFRELCRAEPKFVADYREKNKDVAAADCPIGDEAELYLVSEARQYIGPPPSAASGPWTRFAGQRPIPISVPTDRPFLHIALAGLLNGIGHNNAGIAEMDEWLRKAQDLERRDPSPAGSERRLRRHVWEFRAQLVKAIQVDDTSNWPSSTIVTQWWSEAADTGMAILRHYPRTPEVHKLFVPLREDGSQTDMAKCLQASVFIKRVIYNTYLAKHMLLLYLTKDLPTVPDTGRIARADALAKELRRFHWDCLDGTVGDHNEVEATVFHTVAEAELRMAANVYDGEWSGDAKKHLCASRSALETASIAASLIAPRNINPPEGSYFYERIAAVDDDLVAEKVAKLKKRVQSVLRQAPAGLCT